MTATLRIAVDVTPIRTDGANGGAKPFVLELLRDLGGQNRHTYTLLTTASNHDAFAAFEARGMTRLVVDGMAPPIGLAGRGFDVLFCPMTSPQFAEPAVATVCTLYDLQHLAYPWFFSGAELAHRVQFYRALCERADAIVAISEFSRNALVEHFDVPADRTSVVPIAIHQRHAIPTAAEAQTVLSALGVPRAPFAFYPANFWPHKNHRFLFMAFERFLRDVPDAGLHLVLTGDTLDRGTEIRASIARMGLADRVHVLGFVTDVQLAAIWSEATLLVYPSLYEGFGIPVLEALQFGKPVLSSRAGSLPEVGGDDVTYFDARDPQTLIDALREVLRDLPAAARRAEAARERIAQADSRHSADHYARIFERVAADREARLRLITKQLAKVEHSHAEARAALEATRKALETSEADRGARLQIIERQGEQLGQLAHENAILRGELDGLRPAYKFAESDREARLCVIEERGRQLGEAQAELEATRSAFEVSEADRAARLRVIEDQARQLGELERTVVALREQTQALLDTNVELEQRANRRVFQLIPERLRRMSGPTPSSHPAVASTAPADHTLSAAQLAEQLARGPAFDRQFFLLWEQHGFHITPNHFYSPVPDVSRLEDPLWQSRSDLTGIDMNRDGQLALLRTIAGRYQAEYDAFPDRQTTDPKDYYFDQPMFRSVDAEMLYGVIRHFRPRRIVEIGSGFSTLVAAAACRKNLESGHVTELICIEPFPNDTLTRGVPGVTRLIPRGLEEVDSSLFTSLSANDILFIDSSHVLRIGNDVYREYLSILPSVQPGVLVHVHDIFLPYEYPRSWVKDEYRFWNEQYLLQAFLTFNSAFKIIWAASYMHHEHREKLSEAFRSYDPATVLPGSFWIQRV